ncbi:MAG: tetratricopeptide repeat protein [Magnetococcales bacterium]|nr:tetratricopeptide repeat protein [Magnetococcales bacterium]
MVRRKTEEKSVEETVTVATETTPVRRPRRKKSVVPAAEVSQPETSPPAGEVAPEQPILEEAVAAYQRGDMDQAWAHCRQALTIQPERTEAWTLAGMLCRQAGDLQQTVECYRRAITIAPDYAEAYNNLGNALMALQQFAEAAIAYQRAVELYPDWGATWLTLAESLRRQNRLVEAESACCQALNLDRGSAEILVVMGSILQQQGRLELAMDHFQQAVALAPRLATAHYHLGLLWRRQGQLPEAIHCFGEAIQCQPDLLMAYLYLAESYDHLGALDQALEAYLKALDINPGLAEAQQNVGSILHRQGRIDEAIVRFRQAIDLGLQHPTVWINLGNGYNLLGQLQEAVASYRQASALAPLPVTTRVNLVHSQQHLCDWQDMDSGRLRSELVEPALAWDAAEGIPPSPFPFLSLPTDLSEIEQQKIARNFAGYFQRSSRPAGDFSAMRQLSTERLRIGYVSSDFWDHATAHLIQGLFKHHDRKRFETFVYSFGPDDGSSYRQRIAAECDHFVDLRSFQPEEAVRRVYADGIHVLIDLKGYTRDCHPELFACRPAPVQVAWLGYPGSMGSDFIDYIITDRIVTPPDRQFCYSEKFMYLPHSYQINDGGQEVVVAATNRVGHGLPEQGTVFCCFNSHYKIEPRIFSVWMELLRQLSGSVLWLIDGPGRANLQRSAIEWGVAAERLIFAPRLPKREHLARHSLADLFLDTYYYGAHTTASDALWAGVPLLTCSGERFASRVGASLLHAVGLGKEGLVVQSLEDYRQRALELATHPQQLTQIRQKLQKNRLQQPLFDTARFVQDLESALQKMWQQWKRRVGK